MQFSSRPASLPFLKQTNIISNFHIFFKSNYKKNVEIRLAITKHNFFYTESKNIITNHKTYKKKLVNRINKHKTRINNKNKNHESNRKIKNESNFNYTNLYQIN